MTPDGPLLSTAAGVEVVACNTAVGCSLLTLKLSLTS
jgi:hypothetical protein